MPKRKVVLAVTNDLNSDQRVHKMCLTLMDLGFEPKLVGRIRKNSQVLNDRPYETYRMNLLGIEKGPLFYAFYNVSLFFHLLLNKYDVFVANDLDTLLASYLAAKIKNKAIVYDTHEYYCETPELVNRPFVQNIWRSIEKFIFPKLEHIITVNDSIAKVYQKQYGKELKVVRNVPYREVFQNNIEKSRAELGLPNDKNIIILQGAGININRGAEEAVEAMQYVANAILLIIGSGDVIDDLKLKVSTLALSNKVIFYDKMPYHEMIAFTRMSDLGLSLDKADNLNYQFSLPNKLFDYIHAGIPTLSSRLVELEKIISSYQVGLFIENHDPKHIAEKINTALNISANQKADLKKFFEKAQNELNWEKESEVVKEVYSNFIE